MVLITEINTVKIGRIMPDARLKSMARKMSIDEFEANTEAMLEKLERMKFSKKESQKIVRKMTEVVRTW